MCTPPPSPAGGRAARQAWAGGLQRLLFEAFKDFQRSSQPRAGLLPLAAASQRQCAIGITWQLWLAVLPLRQVCRSFRTGDM